VVRGTAAPPEDDTDNSLDEFVKIDSQPVLPKGWKNCGKPSDLFQIELVTIEPRPLRRSQEITVRVRGTFSQEVQEGKVNYEVSYNMIPLLKDTTDLCKGLKRVPKLPQCPINEGLWDETYSIELPSKTPPGTYTLKASAFDKDGNQIFCMEGKSKVAILSKTDVDEEKDFMNSSDFDSGFEADDEDVSKMKIEEEVEGDRQVKFR